MAAPSKNEEGGCCKIPMRTASPAITSSRTASVRAAWAKVRVTLPARCRTRSPNSLTPLIVFKTFVPSKQGELPLSAQSADTEISTASKILLPAESWAIILGVLETNVMVSPLETEVGQFCATSLLGRFGKTTMS